MLKGVPAILGPELLKILCEMGHGDELVLADGNFPSAALAQRLIRCDGHNVPALLEAILTVFPLDDCAAAPVALMRTADNSRPIIWSLYEDTVAKAEPHAAFEQVERMAFYERTKKAYAVIATSEQALYANILLKKGVVTGDAYRLR